MRTRSSRLFVVLLHIAGVSRNLPAKNEGTESTAINPLSVILEVLRLDEEDGLELLIRKAIDETDEDENQILSEPFWIQVNRNFMIKES